MLRSCPSLILLLCHGQNDKSTLPFHAKTHQHNPFITVYMYVYMYTNILEEALAHVSSLICNGAKEKRTLEAAIVIRSPNTLR